MENIELLRRIKITMAERGITQAQLAKMLGVTQQQISNWLIGYRNPKQDNLEKIARALNKPANYFHKIEIQQVPILGTSPKRHGMFMLEEKEGYLDIPKSSPKQFAIRIGGKAMIDPYDPEQSIYNGSYVIIDPDEKVSDGDVVIAMIDKKYSTIRRIFFKDNIIKIMPDDPNCRTFEIPKDNIEIFGKVIHVYRPIKKKTELEMEMKRKMEKKGMSKLCKVSSSK